MRYSLVFFLLLVLSIPSKISAQGIGRHGGHEVSGIVREAGSDAPVQGVALEISGSGSQLRPSVTSGTAGEFSFSMPEGQYSIVAKKNGYETSTTGVMVFPGGAPRIVISLRKVGSEKVSALAQATSVHQLEAPRRAREAFEKGRKLLHENRQPEKAIPEFQKAIDIYPSYYEAYNEIATAQYNLKNLPEAEAALKKAVELSANKYPDALYSLADLYSGQQRYAEAEPVARQAVDLDPSVWRGHFELARALVGLRRGVEAEASALKSRELNPENPPVYLVLANAHMVEQNYAAAVQDYDVYLKMQPLGPISDAVRHRRDQLHNQLAQSPRNAPQPPAERHR